MKKFWNLFLSLLIVILFLLILIPSISLPFSLIDDPDFAQKYLAVGENVKNFLTTFPGTEQGRLTPTFWTIFITRFTLMGFNPQLHHLFHIAEIGIIFLSIWLVVRKLTENKIIAHLSCFFLLLISSGMENWYRISTQEPGQILSLLLLILVVLKSKKFNWKIPLLVVVFLFSKEISFLLTPIFFVWWWLEENKKEKKKLFNSWVWMASLSLIFLTTLWLINRNSIWAGNNASFSNILPSLTTYWQILRRLYIPQLLLVSISLIFWLGKDRKIKKTAYIFMAWILLDFLALLPWKYSLARLTGTMVVGVAVVLAIAIYLMINKTLEVVETKKNWWVLLITTGVILVSVKFGYVNFLDGYNMRQNYLAWEISNGNFLKEVAQMPENTQIIVNVSKNHLNAHEWIVMMPEYLEVFYSRPDIKINFIDEEFLETEGDSYLAQWSVYGLPLDKDKEDLIWQTEEKTKLLSVSLTQVIKRAFGLSQNPITQENIYSWQIFKN